jgi:hypothetical protein
MHAETVVPVAALSASTVARSKACSGMRRTPLIARRGHGRHRHRSTVPGQDGSARCRPRGSPVGARWSRYGPLGSSACATMKASQPQPDAAAVPRGGTARGPLPSPAARWSPGGVRAEVSRR